MRGLEKDPLSHGKHRPRFRFPVDCTQLVELALHYKNIETLQNCHAITTKQSNQGRGKEFDKSTTNKTHKKCEGSRKKKKRKKWKQKRWVREGKVNGK